MTEIHNPLSLNPMIKQVLIIALEWQAALADGCAAAVWHSVHSTSFACRPTPSLAL